jgi:hypothetical protein
VQSASPQVHRSQPSLCPGQWLTQNMAVGSHGHAQNASAEGDILQPCRWHFEAKGPAPSSTRIASGQVLLCTLSHAKQQIFWHSHTMSVRAEADDLPLHAPDSHLVAKAKLAADLSKGDSCTGSSLSNAASW